MRTNRTRPNRNELSIKLIEQIRNSKKVYKETWKTDIDLKITGTQLTDILNTADLTYTTNHQDYENIGYKDLNFKSRRVPTLQKISAWSLARNLYLKQIEELMEIALITTKFSLQTKDLKTLNNKIKAKLTEEEQEEIDHPELDETDENPRNESLLKFLRLKVHSEKIKNKLHEINQLPKNLCDRVILAHANLEPERKAKTSLADVLLCIKTAVQWILG